MSHEMAELNQSGRTVFGDRVHNGENRIDQLLQAARRSEMVAMSCSRPPQRGQANTSSPKARRMSAAHGC
jgi:hypothetical protein